MIFLEVPYSEKDEAKALGARWNPTARKWYVPPQLKDKANQFQRWLPADYQALAEEVGQVEPSSDTPVPYETPEHLETERHTTSLPDVENRGIGLGQLLQQTQQVLRQGFPMSVWVKAELANINERRGNYYLELVETNAQGQKIAQTRANLWANQAQFLLSKFESATGTPLQAGQNILLQVHVQFHMQYGFSLVVENIDPNFTLGALEAQLQQIRQRLKAENLYDNNKRFALPTDYFKVAVIAPPKAAGLGDFRADADQLVSLGLCEFHYFYSSFQGDNETVAREMQTAFMQFQQQHLQVGFDALVIIRGGGAKLDLMPLNRYEIAKHIALAEIPVLTGIGHERDNTILDEVATQRFDTPSKVSAAIRQTIFEQAQQAKNHAQWIHHTVTQRIQQVKQHLLTVEQQIQKQSLQWCHHWQHKLTPLYTQTIHQSQSHLQSISFQLQQTLKGVEQASLQQVQHQQYQIDAHFQTVTHQAQQPLPQYQNQLTQTFQQIQNLTRQQTQQAQHQLHQIEQSLFQTLSFQVQQKKQNINQTYQQIQQAPATILQEKQQMVKQWMSFILSSGPDRQLQRGFALVKNAQGSPIKSAEQAQQEMVLTLTFADGDVSVTPK